MNSRSPFWLLVVGFGSIFCWQVAQSAPQKDEDAELYRLFVDALENVDRNYVKKVNRRELIESAINGMLEGLDPYSNFIGPREIRQFDKQTKGKFGGIGVQIATKTKDDPYLVIQSPLYNTPAYNAGLLAGDRILKVNGESLKGLTQDEVVDRLTGAPGSEVKIVVSHPPYAKEQEITLQRAVINIESVLGDEHASDDKWDYMLDKQNKIGYIRLNAFVQDTKDDLERALQQLLKDGMKALVVDLRYNPGGRLDSAISISDLFVESGRIVSTTGRNTESIHYDAQKEGTLPNFPMAVLVNHFSASASEILSACLQDHKRAIVVGERTWGKGSVQNVITLDDGKSVLKLTTSSYQRPNGKNIHRFKDATEKDEWGVRPDAGFEVVFSDADHRAYLQQRQKKDRIRGKASEIEKVKEESKAQVEKTEAKPKDPAPDAKADKSKPSEKPAEAAPFKDQQLNKAIEHLKGVLANKTAAAK